MRPYAETAIRRAVRQSRGSANVEIGSDIRPTPRHRAIKSLSVTRLSRTVSARLTTTGTAERSGD